MKTHVAVVLDESWSMGAIKRTLIPIFNDLTKAIVEEDGTSLTFITFATTVHVRFTGEQNRRLPLTEAQYQPNGQTALLDAIGKAVETITPRGKVAKDDAFLVMVFTDGEENASHAYKPSTIASLIRSKQDLGNWTFAVQVPPGKRSMATRFGIPDENVREWEATEQGTKDAGWYANQGVTDYFATRRAGGTQTRSFYAQAQQPATRDVQRNLADLSRSYHKAAVNRVAQIRDYVQDVLRLDYQIGGAFYQLTKPEKIQPNKLVLVEDKKTGAIYGGTEARDLIGLPTYEARVRPSDTGPFNIYIQSTSVNRNLIPGTQVLVRR